MSQRGDTRTISNQKKRGNLLKNVSFTQAGGISEQRAPSINNEYSARLAGGRRFRLRPRRLGPASHPTGLPRGEVRPPRREEAGRGPGLPVLLTDGRLAPQMGLERRENQPGRAAPGWQLRTCHRPPPPATPTESGGHPGGRRPWAEGWGCCGVCAGSWAAPGGLRWPRAPKVTAAILLDSVLLATFGSDLAPTGQPGLFIEPKSGLGFRGTSVSLAQVCGSGPCGLFSAETWARGGGLRGPHPFQRG